MQLEAKLGTFIESLKEADVIDEELVGKMKDRAKSAWVERGRDFDAASALDLFF